jgi:hypothetical protein
MLVVDKKPFQVIWWQELVVQLSYKTTNIYLLKKSINNGATTSALA